MKPTKVTIKPGVYLTKETVQTLGKDQYNRFREYLRSLGYRVHYKVSNCKCSSTHGHALVRLDMHGDLVWSTSTCKSYVATGCELTQQDVEQLLSKHVQPVQITAGAYLTEDTVVISVAGNCSTYYPKGTALSTISALIAKYPDSRIVNADTLEKVELTEQYHILIDPNFLQ